MRPSVVPGQNTTEGHLSRVDANFRNRDCGVENDNCDASVGPWGRESSDSSSRDGLQSNHSARGSWARFDFRSISAVTIGVAAVLGIARQNLDLGAVLGIVLAYLWAAIALIGPRSKSRVRLWMLVLMSGLVATGLGFFVQTLLFGLMLRVTWVALVVIAIIFTVVVLACHGQRLRRWTLTTVGTLLALGTVVAVYQFSQTADERWVAENIYYSRRQHLLTLPARYGTDNRDNISWMRNIRTGLGLARTESISVQRMPANEDLPRFAGLQHCKWAYLQSIELTPELLAALAAMPALENLWIAQCRYDGDWTPLRQADKLKNLQWYSMPVRNYSGIGDIPSLVKIASHDLPGATNVSAVQAAGNLVDELVRSKSLIEVQLPTVPTTNEDLLKLLARKRELNDRGHAQLLSYVRLGPTTASIETLSETLKILRPGWPPMPPFVLTPEQKQKLAEPMEEWEKASTVGATMPE